MPDRATIGEIRDWLADSLRLDGRVIVSDAGLVWEGYFPFLSEMPNRPIIVMLPGGNLRLLN
jgi:hypothetical protein